MGGRTPRRRGGGHSGIAAGESGGSTVHKIALICNFILFIENSSFIGIVFLSPGQYCCKRVGVF